MELFGLGAVWAVFALSMAFLSQNYRHDALVTVSSRDLYGFSPSNRTAARAYEAMVRGRCAAGTSQQSIGDGDSEATYRVRCSSPGQVDAAAGLLILAPVATLFAFTRKRRRSHA